MPRDFNFSTNADSGDNPSTPFYTAYDTETVERYSDENAILPYLRQNEEAKQTESLTWGEMFNSVWTGAVNGIGIEAPNQLYNAIRGVNTWLSAVGMDSDAIEEWAAQAVEENRRAQQEDPWYRPDPEWMKKSWGKALFEGTANVAAQIPSMAAGAAATLGTGGLAGGAVMGVKLLSTAGALIGGSAANNIMAGFAEQTNFIDEAYRELSALDPNITREQIQDEKFWSAVYSGLAEAGPGFAEDVIGGKLVGLFGNNAAKQGAHIVTKLIKNTFSNAATNMGEEAVTAWLQDYIRADAGLHSEGPMAAIQNILKPSLVAGVIGGGVRTGMQTMQGRADQQLSNLRSAEPSRQQQPSVTPAEIRATLENTMRMEQMGRAQEILSPHGFESLQNILTKPEINPQDAAAFVLALDAVSNRAASENGMSAAEVFRTMDPADARLSRMVKAVRNRDADLSVTVPEVYDFLRSRLTPEAQQGIDAAYPNPGDAVSGFQNSIQNKGGIEIPESAVPGFTAMKDVLSDVVTSVGSDSRMRVNPDLYNILKPSELKSSVPEAPAIYRDDETFRQMLSKNESPSTRELAHAVNFDMLAGRQLNAETVFSQMEQALSPYLERKLADSKVRRPDARVRREALKEMESNPGIGYMAEHFDKMYGADKSRLVMNEIMNVTRAKLVETAELNKAIGSVESRFNLAYMTAQFKTMEDFVEGVDSESGRSLRIISRISRRERNLNEKMSTIIKSGGGADKIDMLGTALLNAQNEDESSMIIDAASKTKTSDLFMEYVISGMLSGIPTHEVNIISNTAQIFKSVLERGYAQYTNSTGEGVTGGETGAYLLGMWRSIIDMKRMWADHRGTQGSLRNTVGNLDQFWESDLSLPSDLEDSGMMKPAITGKNAAAAAQRLGQYMGLDVAAGYGSLENQLGLTSHHNQISGGLSGVIDWLGKTIRLPFTMLRHSDAFFKHVAYRAELSAQIHRAAKGDAEAMKQMFANPPKDLSRLAMEHAKEMTFQQDLGSTGRTLNNIRNLHPLTRLMLPFFKTPINVLKEGVAMTPWLNKYFGDMKNKLRSSDPAVRQMAEAKMMVGQLVWGTGLMLASAGYLTGPGPENKDERAKLTAAGRMFNAVKIGDSYVQISRFDPLAGVLNSAAFIVEALDHLEDQELSDALMTGLGQTMRLFSNRSFIESFYEMTAAIMMPERYGESFKRRLGGMFVPFSALGRSFVRSTDEFQREADGFFAAAKQNIPVLSESLPIRHDFLGQPIRTTDTLGPAWLSPFPTGKDTEDPLYAEIYRLRQAGHKPVAMPGRYRTVDGKRVKLGGEDYSKLLHEYGNVVIPKGYTQILKTEMEGFRRSPEYKTLSDEDRANRIHRMGRKYSDAAWKKVYANSPNLKRQFGIKSQGWEYLLGNTTN